MGRETKGLTGWNSVLGCSASSLSPPSIYLWPTVAPQCSSLYFSVRLRVWWSCLSGSVKLVPVSLSEAELGWPSHEDWSCVIEYICGTGILTTVRYNFGLVIASLSHTMSWLSYKFIHLYITRLHKHTHRLGHQQTHSSRGQEHGKMTRASQ